IREEQQKLASEKIIDTPEKPDDQPDSPQVTSRNTEVISDITFFKSGKILENELDIEEYVTQLKGKLMKMVREENIKI
ncbi:TPA: hypothetical protein HA338_05870, partial [Methanosarcina acetivorans]